MFIALDMPFEISPRAIGIQQQRTNDITVKQAIIAIPILTKNAPHPPRSDSNQVNISWPYPAFWVRLFRRSLIFVMALVKLPSGAVLLGMYVPHWSPTISQTPPFSANRNSSACRFCQATLLVAASCSPSALRAASVSFANFC